MKKTIKKDSYEEERETITQLLKNRLRVGKLKKMDDLIAVVQLFDERMDAVIEKRLNQLTDVACKSGCYHCCKQMVGASPAEIFPVVEEINRRSDAEKQNILALLANHANELEASWFEPLAFGVPCPLLDDGRCSVYAVRPSGCRKAISRNVDACVAIFNGTSADDCDELAERFGDEQLQQRALGTRKGFQEVVLRAGLDVEPVDFQHSVYIALKYPDLAARWLQGERVFPMRITATGSRLYDPSVLPVA